MTTSARKRFMFTVGMNLTRSGISFTTGMLVARWLGPTRYGSMAFLLGTFAGLRSLLDMGTSSAFFTFLSQRPRSRKFVHGFFFWLGAQFLLTVVVVGLLLPERWVATIWHGEPRTLVLLAFAAAFVQTSVWPIVQQVGESQRRTYLMQSTGVGITLMHLVAVGLFWWFGLLGLYAVLGVIAVEYLLAAAVALSRLSYASDEPQGPQEPVIGKYLRYCAPLVPFAVVGFASQFADRWMLQNYGGGVQQAFYAVGAQLASIALIATASVLNIFWKEIAEANHRGDRARVSGLYRRVSRLLFFFGAAIAGLLIPWSKDLLRLVLGPAYVGGATTLMVMLLYPVHQSMGQIGATMMYATERVALQVAIGLGTMLFGMTMTYLVLAPPTAVVPGLGLASTGLALKMVGTQVLAVNILAYVIARISKWPFDWIYQPASLLGCVGIGWAAHGIVNELVSYHVSVIARIATAAAVHGVLIGGFAFAAPGLVGLSRGELIADIRRIAQYAGAWRHG